MRSNKIFFLLLLFLTFCTFSFAQDKQQQLLDSFSGKFISAIRTNQKQQVYLVTDKSVFTNGESIWFKAFLLNAATQKISTKSRFLFVDLVNEKDNVMQVMILDALNRQLNSRIILPDSIATGHYWLRAYTRQMAETDINSICVKPIYIVNKTSDSNSDESINSGKKEDSIPAITFYPEGGSIITGVNSTVALLASDSNGIPLKINGIVKDNYNATVSRFSTNINGLGKFDIEASGYRKYTAVIDWHGKEISYPLPAFNFFAAQISVTQQSTGYKLRILLGDSIYKKSPVTYLIGVSKDSLFFASIGKGQYEVPVDEQKIPYGIATFYLFDENFTLLSERSVYVAQNKIIINASTDKPVYGKRDKVTLNISISDANQHPISSLLAISVTDTLLTEPGVPCDLYTTNYKEPEINNILFARNESMTNDEKDLLMLLRNNTYPKFTHQPGAWENDSLLYIKGIALNGKNTPSANKILTLLSNSGDLILHTDTTDNMGHFCFPLQYYADSTQFALEVRDSNGRTQNSKIILDSLVYPKLKTPAFFKQSLPVQINVAKKYLNTYYNTGLADGDKHLLPRVILNGNKKAVNYNQSRRVSGSSTILTSDQLNNRNSVGNAVLNVSGMHILNGFLVVNGPTSLKGPDGSSEPILLVDGVEVGKSADHGASSAVSGDPGQSSPVLSYLNSFNPKDIDFIEILKGPEGANYGVRGGNGVILVNLASKRRDLNQDENNLKIFYAKGVSNPSLFQNIDYQQKELNTTDDNRSTLFWNGSFLTGDTTNATLTFYTSDIPATYRATITGLTIHGDIIYKTITFQSK